MDSKVEIERRARGESKQTVGRAQKLVMDAVFLVIRRDGLVTAETLMEAIVASSAAGDLYAVEYCRDRLTER